MATTVAIPKRVTLEMEVGKALTITASLSPEESISGWTFLFELWKSGKTNTTLISKTDDDDITISNSATGVITISFVAEDTEDLDPGRYLWHIERTNAGFETPLAAGVMLLSATKPKN